MSGCAKRELPTLVCSDAKGGEAFGADDATPVEQEQGGLFCVFFLLRGCLDDDGP
jgi:hypothetical protein